MLSHIIKVPLQLHAQDSITQLANLNIQVFKLGSLAYPTPQLVPISSLFCSSLALLS